jgi:uncharacterized repeat protein (TIGR01451 family)
MGNSSRAGPGQITHIFDPLPGVGFKQWKNHRKSSQTGEEIEMKKRMLTVLALAMAVAVLVAAPVQACACGAQAQGQRLPLFMIANPQSVALGEPVTFTIAAANVLPSDLDLSVRDHLPAGLEFVSASPSQGSCALLEGSNVVQCDLGTVPAGGSALIDITVTPTATGEITNHAADTAENQASATVTVE